MAAAEINLDTLAIAALDADLSMGPMLQAVGDKVAQRAAVLAPKDTGALAASIHAVVSRDSDGYRVDVSWDKDHFYGLFVELGTSSQPARPFLRPALDL